MDDAIRIRRRSSIYDRDRGVLVAETTRSCWRETRAFGTKSECRVGVPSGSQEY